MKQQRGAGRSSGLFESDLWGMCQGGSCVVVIVVVAGKRSRGGP